MTPSGADAFKRRQAAVSERQAQFEGLRADYFGLSDGEKAVVRFLEQGSDLTFAYVHRLPIQGSTNRRDVICLDQDDEGTPCPGCGSDNKDIRARSTKGYVNVIWRNGPIFKRDDAGKPVKAEGSNQKIVIAHGDGVFLWKCSKTVFQMLLDKDGKYKGLMSRDFEIARTGKGMKDTHYTIEPANLTPDGEPMMVADLALAEKRYDIAALTKPPSYEEFASMLHGQGNQVQDGRGGAVPQAQPAGAANVFAGGPPARSSAFTRGG